MLPECDSDIQTLAQISELVGQDLHSVLEFLNGLEDKHGLHLKYELEDDDCS